MHGFYELGRHKEGKTLHLCGRSQGQNNLKAPFGPFQSIQGAASAILEGSYIQEQTLCEIIARLKTLPELCHLVTAKGHETHHIRLTRAQMRNLFGKLDVEAFTNVS